MHKIPIQLKKYSYICFGLDKKNKQVHSGTCFFYKRDSLTVMITNYHVLSGVSTANDSVEYEPVDTLYYTCDSLNQTVLKYMPLPKFTIKHYLHYEKLDIVPVLFKLNNGNTVNYINDLIDTNYFNKKPDSVFVVGFPSKFIVTGDGNTFSVTSTLLSGKYSDSFVFDFIPVFKEPNAKTSMSEEEILTKLRKTEFTIDNKGEPGQSGSPVFGKFKIGNNWEYKFVGMLTLAIDNFNCSLAYKASAIYNTMHH